MRTTLLILHLLIPTILLSQGSNNQVVPIGTAKGVLMAYNFPASHFTIRIEGENVKPAQQRYVFFVDNRVIQLVAADMKGISGLADCKNRADSLMAHTKFELAYLENVLSKKLSLAGHEIISKDSNTFLFWHFNLPAEMNSQLECQLYLTTVVGDKLLMLKTAATKNDQVPEFQNWLTRFAFTLQVYEQLIDIEKLIEEIKKE